MNDSPRITIGLPVYNGEKFIALAIKSMLAQSLLDFELIITDNASTDSTEQICRDFASRDSRISYHRAECNRGIAENFNWPVELARGEYFHWHAADDSAAPTLLEKCAAVLDADPSVVLAFARTMMIDEHDNPLRRYDFDVDADDERAAVRFSRVINLNPRHHCGQEVYGVVRLSELKKTPLYEPIVRTDSILLARLALLGKFRAADQPLFLNREHADRSVHVSKPRSRLSRYIGAGPIPPADFWDPAVAGKIVFPEWQILLAYSRSIKLAAQSERASCRLALARFALKHVPKLTRDVLIAIELAVLGDPNP